MKSIRFKILAMLGIVATGAVIASVLALYALVYANDMNYRSSRQGDMALLTERINSAVLGVVMDSRGIYMSADKAAAERFAKGVEARLVQLRTMAEELGKTVPASEQAAAAAIRKGIADFITYRTETVRLAREVSIPAANAQGNNDANRANRTALNDVLVSFVKRNEAASLSLEQEGAHFTSIVQWVLPLTLLVMLVGSVVAALAFAQRSLTRPLTDLGGVMARLTAGDTQVEVPHAQRQDELGEMARAVAVLRQSIEQVALLQAEEKASAERRLKSAEDMAVVVSDVGDVVAAAAAGDFSARLSIDHADEQMQKLVSGINEINAVVDSATTEFARILQSVASGDLTSTVETNYRGRFADLKLAINETVGQLSSTVQTIQVTSGDVGVAAREINMGADDLSKRTEEQASSLEETAATTEELAASVKASAQSSRQAATLAEEAMQAAQSGGAIASDAVAAMARIEQASQKISDIIRVIDDIAFQTNLLALNAAVEAARAGDAGKGFAVVASEVRTLAQRSGEAAKDISVLISSSNSEVQDGVKLVRQAGDALDRILAASQRVTATIQEISTAAGEQANGIDEMSQAVAHLDEMTQQNAALAEQSAASAGSLAGRITELNALVARFRTSQDDVARPVAPAPQADARGARQSAVSTEPERLRQLAAAAFEQQKATPRHAARAPARKVANGRDSDAGWEEF